MKRGNGGVYAIITRIVVIVRSTFDGENNDNNVIMRRENTEKR